MRIGHERSWWIVGTEASGPFPEGAVMWETPEPLLPSDG